ncbi:hypothetical protein BDQ12DRAFT_724212 [Crucibulum laeve]|uniref:Hypervirulence associated protein TUDOR domain-containing protein n=1 Tax=Crucibulum laeve TaxID=68775 RepID=A0A5C3LWI9_9AGAR|nr:hypothetical protein BDQ12DRAFT_724212 [Crucibulum laeve]
MTGSSNFEEGDHVQYQAVGGRSEATKNSTTTGEIVDVLTEPQPAGDTGVTVKASEKEPRYVIKNDNTGKETAYKGNVIIGEADD